MTRLPGRARVFVLAVLACAALVTVHVPPRPPHSELFLALLVASALTSPLKLRLPLRAGASTLSVSFPFDFATLLLFGPGPAALVAAVSGIIQSVWGSPMRNPSVRIAFNTAALALTAQAGGAAFVYFGGEPGALDLSTAAKPLIATALVYYVTNSALIAGVVALSTGQPFWRTWHENFVWTAPSYFIGGGAAAVSVALWQAHQGWLVPFTGVPVWLTFRSYRIYLTTIAAEKRHTDEVNRLLVAARESEQRYALAAAGSNDGLWDWDVTTDVLYCSDRWKRMLGLPCDARISRLADWLQHVCEDDRKHLQAAISYHLTAPAEHFEHEYRVRHTDGDLRWVLCRGIAVTDAAGRATRMAGSQTDVTESRRVQDTLARAARQDSLTGLPNRAWFVEMLQMQLAQRARTHDPSYAVLFIDLDGFKLVNDSLGHVAGDTFLVAIAHRLQTQLRGGDVLARFGGDEFAVLMVNVTSLDDVHHVSERLQQALAEPFDIEGREIYASASMGIAVGGERYQQVSDVLRDADAAMYTAKLAGRGGSRLFDPAMHTAAVQRLNLETELRRALERQEFVVRYQPIVELATGHLRGVEALVRWQHPDGTVIAPTEFIGVAEETGLIEPITTFVLEETARHLAVWQGAARHSIYASVNISSLLFNAERFLDDVEDVLSRHHLPARSLRLEVTESVLLNESAVVHHNFQRLRALAVPLYLDDFGTGYSSLGYLQRYAIDTLKLDGAFVARLGVDQNGTIAKIIVSLARELGTGLIAEGVETVEQAQQLLALGCPHAQGFLFAKPLCAADIDALVRGGACGAPPSLDAMIPSAVWRLVYPQGGDPPPRPMSTNTGTACLLPSGVHAVGLDGHCTSAGG